MTEPKIRPFNMKTEYGDAVADIVTIEGFRQVNVYMNPNGGAGLFARFPSHCDDAGIREAVLAVLNGEPLQPNEDISSLVKGCEVAGTIEVQPAMSEHLSKLVAQVKSEDLQEPA